MPTLINQRYRVLQELNAGGTSTVYLVEDLLYHQQIALKFLPEKHSQETLAQFKEEFTALEQLQHRNLVRVYEFGSSTEPQGHYFTMEYIPGDDWSTLGAQQRAEKGQPDLGSTTSVLIQLCNALQYIHERGFLHLDLKPSNIRISPNGKVKLVDFGLVRQLTAHSDESTLRGTPAYLAPEVLRGEPVTPSADLYALGVSLYEVISGELPDRDHLNLTTIPLELRMLTGKLLAPTVEARYTSAKEVLQDLRIIGPPHATISAHPPLQNGAFVCRTFELAYLQGILKRAQQGQGRTVFLAGEAGVGKTRLAQELKAYAATQPFLVAEGVCREEITVPYYAWLSIFRKLIAYYKENHPHKLRDYGAVLTRLMPELSDDFAGIQPSPDVTNKKSILLTSAVNFLLESETPLLLILENLHHADDETIELLHTLCTRAPEGQIAILGLYRDAELTITHPLSPLAQAAHLIRRRKSQSTPVLDNTPCNLLVLEPLNESCTTALVQTMLGEVPEESPKLPPDLLPWLLKETGGNPFFIESLIHSLADESYLWNDGYTWHLDTSGFANTTPDIQAITQKQLSRLGPRQLDLLQWAAVAGLWLDITLLARVLGLSPTKLQSRLVESVRHHILGMVSRPEQPLYRFRNEQIRQAIYHTLEESERQQRHELIAQTLLAHFPAEEIAELLAWHFDNAGNDEQAMLYNELAGQKALHAYAGASAVQYFSRALEIARRPQMEATPQQLYTLLSRRVQAQGIQGKYQDQEADLAEMAQLAETMTDPIPQVMTMLQQAAVGARMGRYTQAKELATQAIAQARRIQARHLEAQGLDTLGDIYLSLSSLEQAEQSYKEALRIYRELRDRAGEAHSLWGIASVVRLQGKAELAQQSLNSALTIYRELGDRPGEADVLNALAIQSPDLALQRTYYEQSLAIAKSLNDLDRQARTYNNLALTYWSLGLYNRAYEYANQALGLISGENRKTRRAAFNETLGRIHLATGKHQQAREAFDLGKRISAELGDRTTESLCWYGLGQVLAAEDNHAGAVELFKTAYEIQYQSHVTNYLSATLASMGASYLAMGNWEEAERCTGEALAYLVPSGSGEEFRPQDVWWQRYRVLQESPTGAAASWDALQQAYKVMMEGARTLSDEGLRRNYLNKVTVNREIIIAWTRYTAMLRRSQMASDIYPSIARELDPRTEAKRIKTQLQRILDISSRMNEIHEEAHLFTFIMEQVIELSGAEYGFLATFNTNGRLDYRIARGVTLTELAQGTPLINSTILDSVIQSRTPLLFQETPMDEDTTDAPLNSRSVLCVPLISGTEFLGLLYAGTHFLSGQFSQTDLDMMRLFANQAATAIENAKLYERMSQANEQLEAWARILEERVAERTAELEALNKALTRRAVQLETNIQVSKQTVSILDFNELLQQAATLIQTQFGYYLVSIWLLTPRGDVLEWRAGATPDGVLTLDAPWHTPLSSSTVITSVCRTKQVRYVARTQTTKDFHRVEQFPNVASELAIPLRVGEEVLGVLDISADRANAFSDDEQAVFQSLGDQLAIAIRNAQLYEAEQRRRRFAESLEQAGRELSSSLNLSEVPARILEHLSTLVPYERGAVFLQDGDMLKVLAATGFPDERGKTLELSIHRGDVYWELAHKQAPILVGDVTREPGWHQVSWLPLNYSWIGVPLISRGRAIGMISLTRKEKEAFSEEEVLWVQAFAAQAGVALENARLYAQLHQLSEELEQRVRERTQELNRAYHNLERLDKTKNDFINIAAHELRTPLTVVMGYTQMLRRRLKPYAELQPLEHALSGILSGSNRLKEIINSMLDIAKIDSGALQMYREPVSIAELSRRIYFEFSSALQERHLTLTFENLESLPWIMADPDLIHKVFYHLTINAIKYTPDNGTIIIRGQVETNENDPPSVLLTFSDTGIGIDPQDQDLIFERFYQTGDIAFHSSGRTKFKGAGPGLGLAIVRGIVLAHGGDIWVQSEGHDEEKCPGATFYVRLPIK